MTMVDGQHLSDIPIADMCRNLRKRLRRLLSTKGKLLAPCPLAEVGAVAARTSFRVDRLFCRRIAEIVEPMAYTMHCTPPVIKHQQQQHQRCWVAGDDSIMPRNASVTAENSPPEVFVQRMNGVNPVIKG